MAAGTADAPRWEEPTVLDPLKMISPCSRVAAEGAASLSLRTQPQPTLDAPAQAVGISARRTPCAWRRGQRPCEGKCARRAGTRERRS
jgi:hypothetical protein